LLIKNLIFLLKFNMFLQTTRDASCFVNINILDQATCIMYQYKDCSVLAHHHR